MTCLLPVSVLVVAAVVVVVVEHFAEWILRMLHLIEVCSEISYLLSSFNL